MNLEPMKFKPPTGSPCRECPFRRTSLPGYLGPHTPQNFLTMAISDFHMPCHMEHGEGEPGEESRGDVEDAHQCSGRAIFMSNSCKSPRDSSLKTLPVNRELVLGNPMEFLEHHDRKTPAKKPLQTKKSSRRGKK